MTDLQAHTLLEEADGLREDGKSLHAAQLYLRLIGERPDLDVPWRRLALLYAAQGQWAEAERVLEHALEQRPGNDDLRLLMGDMCAAGGAYLRALEHYRRVRRPRRGRVAYRLGLVHMRLGDMRMAECELRRALELDPRQPEFHESLGEVLIARRLFPDAVKHLRASTRLDQFRASSHRLLGVALLARYRLAEALEEFTQAVDIDPDDAEAWRRCAEVLMRLRRHREAEYYLGRALTLDPKSAETSALLGSLRLQCGEVVQAREAFDEALRVQPHNSMALDGKLRLQLMTEQ